MIDYHVHLWPHAERADSRQLELEQLAGYCEAARQRGVGEIALTEHFFRFEKARQLVGPFWEEASDPRLGRAMGRYWDHHATADLDDYVERVLAAKAAGLPVVLGMEVDYYEGRMDEVASWLAQYPFDVLLGSVHWIGDWMFDVLDVPVQLEEWDSRGTEQAWRSYTRALEELSDSGTCDVLAHPDVVKVAGRRPSPALLGECEERMAEAASRSGMAAEISSAGWRKPAREQYPSASLLSRFAAKGVPVTTASDTHGRALVADRHAALRHLAESAGYTGVRAFRGRKGFDVPFGEPEPAREATP